MVITGLTRNQFVGQPTRGFESRRLRSHESCYIYHIRTIYFSNNMTELNKDLKEFENV